MKRIFILLLVTLFVFSGCMGLAPEGPETIEIDGKTYKTGFYGTLYPNEYPFTEQVLHGDDIMLTRIAHDTFALYHADIGPYVDGTIYCEEEYYGRLQAYYSDPANFTYFCRLGVDMMTGETSQTIEIPDVDPSIFEELQRFAERSNYYPFDNKHKSQDEKEELPMPDDTVQTRLVFYKQSKDSLFISSKGYAYYIIDDHLYLVYQYDYGHGEYEKLIAVKVPDDISTYFVEFMKPYMEKVQPMAALFPCVT